MSAVGTLEQTYRAGQVDARTRYAAWLREVKVKPAEAAPVQFDGALLQDMLFKLADAIARDELVPAIVLGGPA